MNGNQIAIRFIKPEGNGPFPVLIGITGGDNQHLFGAGLGPEIQEMGIEAVDFAPQGRGASEGQDEVAAADWIERHTLQNQALVIALRRDLHRGEAETITLALEPGADLGLLDEREGRHAAQRLELCVASVVGLLLEAKSRSAVDAVRSHLDALRHKAGFYLTDQVYHSALTLAGESDT